VDRFSEGLGCLLLRRLRPRLLLLLLLRPLRLLPAALSLLLLRLRCLSF
jgi:hypothetical protein